MRRFHSPGRVNLMGEHIDYMGGTVLPMALDLGTDLVVTARPDRRIVARSENFPQDGQIVADCDATAPRPQWGWVNHLVAVAWSMQSRGIEIPGVDVEVRGTIPAGAGLSSSASLEVGMAFAFNRLVGAGLDWADLAVLCQRAENDFIGVACGIMDQLAVASGVKGHALAINCAALTVRPVAFPDDIAVIVADTKQTRQLVGSEYNLRRQACEQAQQSLGVALVEVPAERVQDALEELPEALRPAAAHVMTEQARVYAFIAALETGDEPRMGQLMRQSHESLRTDFRVTGPALDAMVDAAWSAPGVIGARMTGAGFGGCTVNLVHPDKVEAFTAYVADRYTQETGLVPAFHQVRAADGAHEVAS